METRTARPTLQMPKWALFLFSFAFLMDNAFMFSNQKRKGFWSNVFGRSSNATKPDENKNDQAEDKGFMSSLMSNTRQGVTNVAEKVAEDEAKKYIEAQLNNTNGAQPTNTTTSTADTTPDASGITTTTPGDVLNAPTNWAKRMVDRAQQKVQNLQQDLTS
ncbi:hypothetical protein J3R82DRAFT_2064 [Butyriboletus roseoflavus]|nr:hypothetical protein J3R82DRAFT_2064 [Butyriboletus roseoflavus]